VRRLGRHGAPEDLREAPDSTFAERGAGISSAMRHPGPLALLLLTCLATRVASQAVSGQVFADTDADGIRDAGEAGIAALPVAVFGNGVDVIAASAADGTFIVPVAAGCRGIFIGFPPEPDPASGATGAAWRRVEADSRTCPEPGANPVGRARYGIARHLRTRLLDPTYLYVQLGDSIAAGVSVCVFSNSDYSDEVAAELDCLGPGTIVRDNRGVGGWHSEDLLTPLDGGAPNDQFIPNVIASSPDLVTLSIGGNDFLNTEPDAAGQNYPFRPADLQRSFQELVSTRRTVQEILSSLVTGLPGADIEINSVYDNQSERCSTTDFHAAVPPMWNQMLRHLAWGQLRPVQVGETEPEFAHQDVLRGSCCGAEDQICVFDGIHPTQSGAAIIQHALMESLGRVQVGAGGATGVDIGALQLVAVLSPAVASIVAGSVGAADAALILDGMPATAGAGAILEVSGFTLPAGVTPVRVIAGVRFKTTAAFADDTHLFDASFVDFAAPQWSFTGWDTSTPLVGGSGLGGNIAASSRVNAMPNVTSWRDVTAMVTLNAVDDGRVTGSYSWPDPTAADIASLKIRLTVSQAGTPDAAQVEWDGAWLWVYGTGSGAVSPPGEVSGAGDGPLLVRRSNGIVLTWDGEPAAETYRIWRGDIGNWTGARAEPGVAGGCVAAPLTTWTESEPPDQRPNWYFLVSAINAGGAGPLGFDSFGRPETAMPAGCP